MIVMGVMTTHRSATRGPASATVVVLAAVLLAACSTSDSAGTTDSASSTETTEEASATDEAESTETATASEAEEPVATDHPEPRLVVGYADRVAVLDAEDLTELAGFEVDSAPYAQPASDGRHVFTLEHQEERIRIIDTGTWTEAHGDHGHSYVVEPSRLDNVIDGVAYHAVSDEEKSVIWNDSTGNIEVIETADFEDGEVTPVILELGDVHHGVAVPFADGYLASFSQDDSAVGIIELDNQGNEIERFEGCPGLHGEAHVGANAYAFGCQDGIMVVDESGARKVASPVEGAGTGTLVGDGESPVLAGNLRSAAEDGPDLSTTIALYDTAAGTARTVDLGVKFSSMNATEGELVVIGVDGNLHLVDLASGEVRTIAVTEPWEVPEEFLDPRPMLTVSGDRAWLTEPMVGKILAVDLTSGETIASIDVEDKPDRIAVVNAGEEEHAH